MRNIIHFVITDLTGFKNLSGLKVGFKPVTFLLISFVFFASCKKNKSDQTVTPVENEPIVKVPENTFTRQAMLLNLADNIIGPSLASFSNQSDSLYNSILIFIETPTQSKLDTIQSRLDKTALAWQYCSWFRQGAAVVQFGSVDGAKKFDQINTFPVLTSKIEAYIAAADYSLVNTDYDTRGLCAIEYLIHTFDEKDSVIVANFVSSENRKAYLKALVLAIKTRANTVKNAWATDRANYISAVGMDGESSCSHTALDMDVDFDNIKNNKVGIPVGRVVAGLELLAFPDKTEAFYSGYSLKYLRANIKAIENVWLGRSLVGTDGLGFDDYLNSVNAANITLATKSKFNAIYAKLDAIPEGRLSEIIKTNKEPVRELYAELQGLTQYLKTDMVSALGLSITYASGDGD